MNDPDGFNFTVGGTLGQPPYWIRTTDGGSFVLPESIVIRQGETHRECFERNLAEGRIIPRGHA